MGTQIKHFSCVGKGELMCAVVTWLIPALGYTLVNAAIIQLHGFIAHHLFHANLNLGRSPNQRWGEANFSR